MAWVRLGTMGNAMGNVTGNAEMEPGVSSQERIWFDPGKFSVL
jgi:hypothetical protein